MVRTHAELADQLGIWTVCGRCTRAPRPGRPATRCTSSPPRGARSAATTNGLTFGCAICIEVNFPEVFAAYEQMNVNCMLVSVMAEDAIRPGCPGPKRDKMTSHGKEKNGPHSREFPAIGPFSQVVAGVV
jgi:hypothetical protein